MSDNSHGNIQHQSEKKSQQVAGQPGQLKVPGLLLIRGGGAGLGVDPVLQQVPGASPVGHYEGSDHTGGPEEICQRQQPRLVFQHSHLVHLVLGFVN